MRVALDLSRPHTAQQFEDIHDYMDANDLLIAVLDAVEVDFDADNPQVRDLIVAAQDEADKWLALHRVVQDYEDVV